MIPLTVLLAITASPLINAFIWIIVVGLIAYLLWWLIGYVALPAPFDKVARVLLAVVFVIVLINFLLQILGNPF